MVNIDLGSVAVKCKKLPNYLRKSIKRILHFNTMSYTLKCKIRNVRVQHHDLISVLTMVWLIKI